MEEKYKMSRSTEFVWNPDEFSFLLESCKHDDGVQLSLKYMVHKRMRILEAGCGSGRVVKYFSDLGYRNVHGIELNQEIVTFLNSKFSELHIIQGDILDMQYGDDSFDIVVAYGVVEHFREGLEVPLRSLSRVLRSHGIAIVTVPSFNSIRQWKHFFNRHFRFLNVKNRNWMRKLMKKRLLPSKRNDKGFKYHVYPQFGEFFEYRLKPKEFEEVCVRAGFDIVESVPIAHIDGLYHESGSLFRKCFLQFDKWSFRVSKPAVYLNTLLKKKRFFHNHMHACVLRKP